VSRLARTIGGRPLTKEYGTLKPLAAGQSSISPVYNVRKDFGAVADGSTEDTQAIRNAVQAAMVSGGTVYFPRGTYLTDTINFYPDNTNGVVTWGRVHIMGDSSASYPATQDSDLGTQIIHKDGSANPLFNFDNPDHDDTASQDIRNVTIEQMLLVSGTTTTHLIYFHGGTNINRVRDCFLRMTHDGCNGITLDSCWHMMLENLRIFSTAAGGTGQTDSQIGVYCKPTISEGTMNMIIMDNLDIYKVQRGIQIGHTATGGSTDFIGPVIIRGGQIAITNDIGLYIGDRVQGVLVDGMHFEQTYLAALAISNDCNNISVRGCHFNDNGEDGSAYNVEIGNQGDHKVYNVSLRNLYFNTCARGIYVDTDADMDNISIDHIDLDPETNTVGTGIKIESVTQYVSKITLGPNIRYSVGGNAFATDLDDANNNAARSMTDYRTYVLSGGETSVDTTHRRTIRFNNGGATTVTDFTNGYQGQVIEIMFANTNTTIANNGGTTNDNIRIAAGANYTPSSAFKTLTLKCSGTTNGWYEASST